MTEPDTPAGPDAREPAAPRLPWAVVTVRGRSMAPTLSDGDRLLVRWGGRPRPGCLAVIRLPGGRPLAVKRLTRREPEGWWAERDNPREGVDSWLVGGIPDADVLAVVLARAWPRPRRFRPSPGRPGA